MSETKRTRRVADVIQHNLAALLQREYPLTQGMITILDVKISIDLSYATIFITTFGCKDENEVLRDLNKKAPLFRKLLARNWASKKIPELRFSIDDTLLRANQLNNLIDSLVKV